MSKNETAQNIWASALKEIVTRIAHQDRQWFDKIVCEGLELSEDGRKETLVLRALTSMAEIWVNDNYRELVTQQITLAAGRTLHYRLPPPQADEFPAKDAALADTAPAPVPAAEVTPHRASRQRAHSSANSINPSYTFDTFMVGPENELAHAAAIAVANKPGESYNPLFIYGPTGVGKTHLLHAIANAAQKRDPDFRVIYVTCEAFTNEYIEASFGNNFSEFRHKYRNTDFLLIDDIQFLKDKEKTQDEFFHTFNHLRTNLKQIVLTSDRPAREIKSLEERLVSRFNGGFTADITAPRFETRVGILRNKAEMAGLEIQPETIDFLAKRIAKNVRNLEGAILKLNGYQKLIAERCRQNGTPVPPLSEEDVKKVLHDMIAADADDRISVEIIQQKVADFFKVPTIEMTGKKRTAHIAFVRQVAMLLAVRHTGMSLSAIGEAFGGRDHGTVIHARKEIEARMETTPAIKSDVIILEERILNPRG